MLVIRSDVLGRLILYRARQKNGSQVERIFQARPGRSGKQQQEQNSRNLGTVFFAGPCTEASLNVKLNDGVINYKLIGISTGCLAVCNGTSGTKTVVKLGIVI